MATAHASHFFGPAGVQHGNGACVSFFRTWQCMYVTVVTLFRQSTYNTVLILESL